MRGPEHGIACAGCPHRAAYVVCKDVLGRGRSKVMCGDVGCPVVGPMHPAAITCPGGEEALLPRYKREAPVGGTVDAPAHDVCIHFALDTDVAAGDAVARFDGLAAEGAVTVLAVLASSRAFTGRDALELLGERALELGAKDAVFVDPFDTVRAAAVVEGTLARPGLHAVVFASPCTRLLREDALPEPVEIDRFACVGCHRCKQVSGCPALEFAPPQYRVDAGACTGCDLCVGLCRTHVIYSARNRLTPEERSRQRYAALRGAAEGRGAGAT